MTEEALDPAAGEAAGQSEAAPSAPRRRRRGGRGRGRGTSRTPAREDAAATEESSGPADGPSAEEGAGQETPRAPRSRSRSRSRGGQSGRTKRSAAATPDGQAAEGAEAATGSEAATEGEKKAAPKPRRRTSTRRSSGTRQRPAAETVPVDEGSEPVAPTEPVEEPVRQDGQAPAETASQKRRRRRRRRRKPAEDQTGAAAKPSTEAAAPESPLPAEPEPVAIQLAAEPGATRTARPRDRRRAPLRRRTPQILPARRTDKLMLLTEQAGRIRIAVLEGRELVEHYVTRTGARSMVGNIYLGRVQNVLPGMEAAFVDVGRGRNAVLYAGEVSYDEDVEASDRRIERVLKPGQSVLVQVTKDPMGGKGARLTAQISLPGRYLVYVPEGGLYGISRRLPDNERRRLRDILKEIRPSGAGVIVRTAAEGASAEDLAADLERLRKTWDSIKRKSRRAKAPAAMYEEPDLTIRVIRDVFSPGEFREIVTDNPEIYEQVREYLAGISPELVEHVRLHIGPLPVFEEHHVLEQIHKALERKVWLPSGGYLVIDRTEAMTVIDVNTGKHVGKTNLEETVVGTNIEAAREIARQLRLRDIGGIIVIDFIDMLLEKNRDLVIRTLKEAMAQDKTRSQVFDITPLGLLEVTRKKVSAGLVEAFSETCPTCEGRGILLTHEV